jgi:hypothetical protein
VDGFSRSKTVTGVSQLTSIRGKLASFAPTRAPRSLREIASLFAGLFFASAFLAARPARRRSMNSTPAGADARALGSKRIDDFHKGKLIEISIPSADSPDPMLAHEDCRMSIMHQIASQVWQFQNHVPGDLGMTLGRDENGETRRVE